MAQLGSRWQASGTSSREQVMIRQPSCENRITVAWPIPRLAPVKTTVFGFSDLERYYPMPLANTARARLVDTDDLESSLTAVLFDDRHIFAVFENMVVQSEQRFIIVFGVSIVVEERTAGGVA